MKKIILVISVILFMSIIFIFSNFKGEDSDNQSIGFLENTVGKIASVFDKDITEEEKESLYLKLNYPFRKIAHICEYFILSLLVCLLLNSFKLNVNKIILFTFLISFLFACGDEIHQLYVVNRNGSFFDVMVDSIGIILFLGIYYFKERRKMYD